MGEEMQSFVMPLVDKFLLNNAMANSKEQSLDSLYHLGRGQLEIMMSDLCIPEHWKRGDAQAE
jgi:hypothetical protein